MRATAREGNLKHQAAALHGEKIALQKQQQQWLAWSGQAMVSNSLNIMENAVEDIRTAFLLPQKELRQAPDSASCCEISTCSE
jgi:hypothetical protein